MTDQIWWPVFPKISCCNLSEVATKSCTLSPSPSPYSPPPTQPELVPVLGKWCSESSTADAFFDSFQGSQSVQLLYLLEYMLPLKVIGDDAEGLMLLQGWKRAVVGGLEGWPEWFQKWCGKKGVHRKSFDSASLEEISSKMAVSVSRG